MLVTICVRRGNCMHFCYTRRNYAISILSSFERIGSITCGNWIVHVRRTVLPQLKTYAVGCLVAADSISAPKAGLTDPVPVLSAPPAFMNLLDALALDAYESTLTDPIRVSTAPTALVHGLHALALDAHESSLTDPKRIPTTFSPNRHRPDALTRCAHKALVALPL